MFSYCCCLITACWVCISINRCFPTGTMWVLDQLFLYLHQPLKFSHWHDVSSGPAVSVPALTVNVFPLAWCEFWTSCFCTSIKCFRSSTGRMAGSVWDVPVGSPSNGGDVADYAHSFLHFFYSVLMSISIFLTLSTVFDSIYSSDNSSLSHSVLPVLFLPYWSLQLCNLFMIISLNGFSSNIIPSGWLGPKHQLTIWDWSPRRTPGRSVLKQDTLALPSDL